MGGELKRRTYDLVGWLLTSDLGPIVLTFGAMSAIIVSAWVGGSYFEAAAYERVTGHQVSTWEAMFLDLRVQEGAADGR